MTEIKVGIPRAREVLFKLETLNMTAQNFTAVAGAMALHAQAIAAVEQAEATRLLALVALLDSPVGDVTFSGEERYAITEKIREIVGMSPTPADGKEPQHEETT